MRLGRYTLIRRLILTEVDTGNSSPDIRYRLTGPCRRIDPGEVDSWSRFCERVSR